MVDIGVKSGTTNPGGEASVMGGSYNWIQPALQYGGRSGAVDYFAVGQYVSNGIGIENPTSSYTPLHDDTAQWYALTKVTGIVDENTRLSFIGGGASARYQIPNVPGQTPNFTVNGISELEQLDPRPAPVGGHLFRHRLAAEELPGLQPAALGLRPLLQALLPARRASATCSTTASRPRRNRTSLATGVQGDASWKVAPTTRCAAASWSSASASPA